MAFGKEILEQDVIDSAVGLILPLPLLVLHDAALLIKARLIHRPKQVPHAVGLHPQRQVERVPGDDLEIVGAVNVGGAVHARGANPLEGLKELARIVLRAVEHEMFKKMGEPGLARLLILRADVVPNVHRHDRGLAVLMDDQGQAVVEDELLERDGHAHSWFLARLVGKRDKGHQGQHGERPPKGRFAQPVAQAADGTREFGGDWHATAPVGTRKREL